MNIKELYRDDLLNRFAGHTFTETVVDSMTMVEFKDGSSEVISKAQTLVVDDAYQTIRQDLVGKAHDVGISLTTVQRDALSAPEAGLQIYNLDNNQGNEYNGTTWKEVSLSTTQSQALLFGESTGVFSGGVLSGTVGLTTFDIAAGTGQVIDNSVPGTTTEDLYNWDAFAAVALTNLGSASHTYVFLSKVAEIVTVVQIGDDSVITALDRKTMVYLGLIRHGTGTFVGAISQPQTIAVPANKLIDLYIATGKVRLSTGNGISATGAGLLTIDKVLGQSYGIGVNEFADGNDTDFVDNAAIVAASMLKYSSVGHIDGALISNVDTGRYDPNGAMIDAELVDLSGSENVVHRIWIEAITNLVIFQYGQVAYSNTSDALASWQQEDLTLPTGLNESSYLRTVIVVQNNDSNLDGATFIPVSGTGGAGGGTVTPTNIIDDLLSTDPNSALSANQGRVLNLADVASGAVSGDDIVLTKNDASTITITNGGANIANSNLTLDDTRLVFMDGNALIFLDGAMPLLSLSAIAQAALILGDNSIRATIDGVFLSFDAAGDLQLDSDAGTSGQVVTSNGPNLPPIWKAPANIANTNLKLDAARTVDLEFSLLMIGISSAGTPIFHLEPGTRALISFLGNGIELNGTGVELTFIPGVGDLKIDNDAGTANQVLTSQGPGEPPTWETSAGGLASDSYLSINNTANDAFQLSNVVSSTTGFGAYNVLELINAFLHRTIDPSGMLQLDNTCVIQVDGTYDIHWSVSDDIGTQTYVHIRVNGTIISSGHSGSDTGAAGMVTNTVAELVVGDIIEFAFSNAVSTGSANIKRPNIKINQIR